MNIALGEKLLLNTIMILKRNNSINTYMNNRKAAKKLIKRAKCCPEYYSEAEVKYAKMIKNREKLLTKSAD